MRVAVTGASGFLGSHITQELMKRGHDVVAVVRTPAKAAWLGCSVRQADLCDEVALARAFEGCDAVVSNAALAVRDRKPSLDEFRTANVQGTLRVIRACSASGVTRVVGISTLGVDPTWRWRHLAGLTTNRLYLKTKGEGEAAGTKLAAERELPLVWLRPGPIYGSRDHKVTARYRRAAQRRVVWAPTLALPHVHAADVGAAVAGALMGGDGAYGLAGPSVSLAHIMRITKTLLQAPGWVVPVPVPFRVGFNDSRAREELGFAPRSIEEGLREALSTSPEP